MLNTTIQRSRNALKRLLKACGLDGPARAVRRRIQVQSRRASQALHRLTGLLSGVQFDRTRTCLAVQAELTRAAMARDSELLHELIRSQVSSLKATMVEQSERTRSELGAPGRLANDEGPVAAGEGHEAWDGPGRLDALRRGMHGPVTEQDILGACKLLLSRPPEPLAVAALLEEHRRGCLGPAELLRRLSGLLPVENERADRGGLHGRVALFNRVYRDPETDRLSA
ncbi:MAG: hypothetical protein U0790_13365 [Isosphaeraceae bacterium]